MVHKRPTGRVGDGLGLTMVGGWAAFLFVGCDFLFCGLQVERGTSKKEKVKREREREERE